MASRYSSFAPYVPVAARRAAAARHAAAERKKGGALSPVVLRGRTIASSFWGQSWCDNLEAYSDYANRLPRGRAYARNGSVIDLQIAKGVVRAKVSGSSIYTTTVRVAPIDAKAWRGLVDRHASGVSSVVDLLQGRLPKSLLEALSDRSSGLFPSPREMQLSCSCPDWASMCKHVAAVLYGVGARLDERPELFFELRGVEVTDLATHGGHLELGTSQAGSLEGADLGELFGIELAPAAVAPAKVAGRAERAPKAPVIEPATKSKPSTRRNSAPSAERVEAAPAPPRERTTTNKAKKARRASSPPGATPPIVTGASLRAGGLSARAIAQWVRAGALEPTGVADEYRVAPVTAFELAGNLEAGSRAQARKRAR